jgi:flagellar motor switch protein FliN/FliY
VNTTTSVPYSWLKTIKPELLQADTIPLLGNPPSFPWEQFSEGVSQFFQIKNLKIIPGDLKWRSKEELFEGFSSDRYILNLSIATIDGHVSWVMNQKDIGLMMNALLNPNKPANPQFIDKDFLLGFYYFTAVEILGIFTHVDFDKTLSPQLLDDHTEPSETALCQDIKISTNGESIVGRLILPTSFQQAWKERYVTRNLKTNLSQELSAKVPVNVGLECGRAYLSRSDFKQIALGDFIALDLCSYYPDENKGKVLLTVNGLPFLSAALKNGSLNITDAPVYQEVVTAMDKNPPEDQQENNEDAGSEFEDTPEEEVEFEDAGIETESDEDEEEQEFSEEQVEEFSQKILPGRKGAAKAAAESQPTGGQPVAGGSLSRSDITASPKTIGVTLIVEAGRLNIPIAKLLELQPGNLLDLDIKPENGVDLVVNGQCIGKGELLKVGDTLGVRILDLG